MFKVIKTYCPFCDKEHDLEVVQKEEEVNVKGELIKYKEENYYCSSCDAEFCNGEMEDNNLLKAKDEYRKKHNLLTSDEIRNIREKYCLSQSDLALILGWGEVTITRYETKEIQNENYDKILRRINDNPYELYDCFKMNCNNFSQKKRMKILKKLFSIAPNEEHNNCLLEDTLIKRHFTIDEIYKGNRDISLSRIFAVIKEILKTNKKLYKTKLVKLLWYIDINNYKKTKESITGLSYLHMTYGACPLGLDLILNSKSIEIEENEVDDSVMCLIKKVESDYILKDIELESIREVSNKFKNYTTKEIIEYMHNEKAYLQTIQNELISFEYAKYVTI